MMRRKDEESFCVYCRDIKKGNIRFENSRSNYQFSVVPKVEESAPEENHKSCEEHKFFGVISEERLKEIDAGVDHVLKICSQQLVNLKPLDRLTSHWAGNSCTTGPENSHQDIQKCLSTIEQAVKLHQLIFKQRK